MARIPREEHATIRRRIDVEGQKVAEVAATYGCTPANIYAILAKQRRQGAPDAGSTAPPPSIAEVGPAPAVLADLFTAEVGDGSQPASPTIAVPQPE